MVKALCECRPLCRPAVSPRCPVPRCLTTLASGPGPGQHTPSGVFQVWAGPGAQKPSAGLVWPLPSCVVALPHHQSSSTVSVRMDLCPGSVWMNPVRGGMVTESETPASEGTTGCLHFPGERGAARHAGAHGEAPVQVRRQKQEPGECGSEPRVGTSQEGEGEAVQGSVVWAHSVAWPEGGIPCCPASTWLGV